MSNINQKILTSQIFKSNLLVINNLFSWGS